MQPLPKPIKQSEMEVLKSANFLCYALIAMLLTSCMDKNSAPEAHDDSASLYQGESTAIEVLKNDSDAENDPLQIRIHTAPSHGSISLQSDGVVIYHHDGSSSTQDSFTYTLYDGAADSAPADVNLSITLTQDDNPDSDATTDTSSTNTAPVANNDSGTVTKGGRVSLSLLNNDRDAENDTLSILTMTNPVNGSVSQHTDGTVIYQHDGSSTTDDHFSYTISDGMISSEPANVDINITSDNRPPEFTHSGIDLDLHVNELYSLVVNANDPDGDKLTFSAANLPYWLVFSPSTHTLTGVPSWAELDKSYTLTLSVSDGMKTVENSFTLTVVGHQAVTDAMAHRLLLQTTYGPTLSDIQQVKQLGIVQWIDNQLAIGSAYNNNNDGWKTHLQRTQEIAIHAEPDTNWMDSGVFNEASGDNSVKDYQMAAWWGNALGSSAVQSSRIGSDQLRQRTAYALSQLLVVSDSASILGQRGEALAAYYDLLVKHAFGNYRTLLGVIARSPGMGVYLSHQGNSKANPLTGTRPDENFAREVIQLFTVGLHELNLDGSPNRDGNSSSYPDSGSDLVPTYTQTDIEELAKVMTGWDLANNDRFGRLHQRDGDYTHSMVFHPSQHEDEAAEGGDGNVTVLGQTFPLNSGTDHSGLDQALNILFNHPNMAPYVSRHLIQRLVTSNPSSDYVARVSRIFNDNGNGIKGDLKAVIRAILLDPEARDNSYLINPAYGKSKEPLLAITQLLRAIHTTPLNGWISQNGVSMNDVFWFRIPQHYLGQGPMRSPSVFNFYSPNHVPRDNFFTTRQLVGPEFQIQTDQMLIEYNNLVFSLLESYEKNRIISAGGKSLSEFAATKGQYSPICLLTNLDTELTLFEQALEGDNNRDFISINDDTLDSDGDTPKVNAIDTLLDHLDLLLLGRQMTPEFKSGLKHYLTASAGTNTNDEFDEARRLIRDAITLIVTSSSYMIQK